MLWPPLLGPLESDWMVNSGKWPLNFDVLCHVTYINDHLNGLKFPHQDTSWSLSCVSPSTCRIKGLGLIAGSTAVFSAGSSQVRKAVVSQTSGFEFHIFRSFSRQLGAATAWPVMIFNTFVLYVILRHLMFQGQFCWSRVCLMAVVFPFVTKFTHVSKNNRQIKRQITLPAGTIRRPGTNTSLPKSPTKSRRSTLNKGFNAC